VAAHGCVARRQSITFPYYLLGLVRSAVEVRLADLGQRFVAEVAPVNPFTEHSLVAANASLAESGGDMAVAERRYADAARRWHDFGQVPEEGFALVARAGA
jgi:hypothetical protein